MAAVRGSGQKELLVSEHPKLKAPSKVVIVRATNNCQMSDAPQVLGAAKNSVRATLQTVTIRTIANLNPNPSSLQL